MFYLQKNLVARLGSCALMSIIYKLIYFLSCGPRVVVNPKGKRDHTVSTNALNWLFSTTAAFCSEVWLAKSDHTKGTGLRSPLLLEFIGTFSKKSNDRSQTRCLPRHRHVWVETNRASYGRKINLKICICRSPRNGKLWLLLIILPAPIGWIVYTPRQGIYRLC